MRLLVKFLSIAGSFVLTSCIISKGSNPVDPYESINRKTHKFNKVLDTIILKPAAVVYKTIIPGFIRTGINNAYNNVNMIPTFANDLLQADWTNANKDAGRFVVNSTIGIGGLFDVAARYNLPERSNDLGITFAKWGDKNSPYIVIPFLGPSTIRDGMGMMFNYTFLTPYPYLDSSTLTYSLLGLRYVDLRSQMLETDRLIAESLDEYAFIRDAYLQHRNYLITGAQNQEDSGSLYVDDADEQEDASSALYVEE